MFVREEIAVVVPNHAPHTHHKHATIFFFSFCALTLLRSLKKNSMLPFNTSQKDTNSTTMSSSASARSVEQEEGEKYKHKKTTHRALVFLSHTAGPPDQQGQERCQTSQWLDHCTLTFFWFSLSRTLSCGGIGKSVLKQWPVPKSTCPGYFEHRPATREGEGDGEGRDGRGGVGVSVRGWVVGWYQRGSAGV